MIMMLFTGCSGGGGEEQADPASTTQKSEAEEAAEALAAKTTTPEAATRVFLEAVRTGDDELTAEMLTPLAREKTAEMDMVVAPPGSDTAKYEIGKVERLEGEGARVSARWSDLDETGEPRHDDMTWMLRQEPNGWRIAGVAATVFPGEPPLLLNFEDPEDMVRQQEMLREELTRRAAQGQQGQEPLQAKQPENSQQEIRR
jgi:hypothetical protein